MSHTFTRDTHVVGLLGMPGTARQEKLVLMSVGNPVEFFITPEDPAAKSFGVVFAPR